VPIREDPSMSVSYEDVLSFWFGELDALGCADSAHTVRWWKKDPDFDQSIRERFAALHAAVASGERDAWLASPRGRLACIIVLDQFSRNMFRETPACFAHDAQALRIAEGGIEQGMDRLVGFDGRGFCYMPLMHTEQLEAQERCVQLFDEFLGQVSPDLRPRVEFSLKFAEMHRDIVKRFGRFPHRNRLLGRDSTPEEVEFLSQPGSAF
jgi:uncharacterized protein (DUF924 family)